MAKPPNTIVDVLSRVDTMSTECWIWTGPTNNEGYGTTAYQAGSRQLVHRVVYEALVRPIPPGLVIDHLCRVRSCCNPEHLEPVTYSENNRRGAQGFGLTGFCKNGLHDLTRPGAIYVFPGTDRRVCHECRKAAKRASYRRARTDA